MSHSLVIPNRIISAARWSEREARVVLTALVASKLSPAEFARRYSIQAQRIYSWQRRLAGAGTESASVSPPAFVEIGATAYASPTNAARYELVTAHGESLRIDGPVDAAAVRTLLGILREGRAC